MESVIRLWTLELTSFRRFRRAMTSSNSGAMASAWPSCGHRAPTAAAAFSRFAGLMPESLDSSASMPLRWLSATTRERACWKLLTSRPGVSVTKACCFASASWAKSSSALIFASAPSALPQASARRPWNLPSASARRARKGSASQTGSQSGSSSASACSTALGFMPLGLASSASMPPSFATTALVLSSFRCMALLAAAGSAPVRCSAAVRALSAAAAARRTASIDPRLTSAAIFISGASSDSMMPSKRWHASTGQPSSWQSGCTAANSRAKTAQSEPPSFPKTASMQLA
mmetsp:Transcript_42728/g.135752  ORF Transcript_42728/g.135752 Transcript_42728/m.135752 type:complete len:289 (+) Transcript_42728:211-1077(+)